MRLRFGDELVKHVSRCAQSVTAAGETKFPSDWIVYGKIFERIPFLNTEKNKF